MRVTLVLLLITIISPIKAQCDITSRLVEDGFENIIQLETNDGTEIHYENRRYRYEGIALKKVLEFIAKSDCISSNVALIIYNKGVPITEINTTKEAIINLIQREGSFEEFARNTNFNFTRRKRPKEKVIKTSYLKSDIAVGAQIDYLLGNFDNPIRWTPKLLPSFQTTLSKGVHLNATYGAVLYDDLYSWETSRWRYAFASHNGKLPGGIFTRVSAGFFENTQYGIEGHATKLFLEDRIRIDLNLSLTENKFLDTPPGRVAIDKNHFSYGLKATYRYQPWTTDLSIHYGRYIFDDTGYTVRFERQINEVFIGFFMRETDQKIVGSFGKLYDKNYGFTFTVPIGTKKHLKPSYLRPKTDEQFQLDYNYTGGVSIGVRIHAPGTIIQELKEYYPSTLKKALEGYFTTF